MTDSLSKAKSIIDQFDGNITEGQWYVNPSCDREENAYIHLDGKRLFANVEATKTDIDAMSSVPEMLALIKDFVEKIEKVKEFRKILWAGSNPTEALDEVIQILERKQNDQ